MHPGSLTKIRDVARIPRIAATLMLFYASLQVTSTRLQHRDPYRQCTSCPLGKKEIEWLVGGFNPSEKYESVGMIIPYIMENKTCSKPPTRWVSPLLKKAQFPNFPNASNTLQVSRRKTSVSQLRKIFCIWWSLLPLKIQKVAWQALLGALSLLLESVSFWRETCQADNSNTRSSRWQRMAANLSAKLQSNTHYLCETNSAT